jgi:hypothetical protein
VFNQTSKLMLASGAIALRPRAFRVRFFLPRDVYALGLGNFETKLERHQDMLAVGD